MAPCPSDSAATYVHPSHARAASSDTSPAMSAHPPRAAHPLRSSAEYLSSFRSLLPTKNAPAAKPRGIDELLLWQHAAPQQSGAATPSSSSTLMGLAALVGSVTWFGGRCNQS